MNLKAFNAKKAPLYWSAYQYLYEADKKTQNAYISQAAWLDNINWIDQNLKCFGFDMICIDGWGDDFTFTQNGYRTKHSTKWAHDYQWWSNYLQSKGMTLGIYNNPLWVNMQAVNAGKKIKGTNIPLENIINRNEKAMFFNWVQVQKDGAREFVKGYVQYYADMGVKYLRVDFLSWFQDGKDRNPDFSRPIQRPRLYYQIALKWIKDACDENNMIFSLVMPHLYNYAEDQKNFAGGSMIRINADVLDGGWQRFNNVQRGIVHDLWSTLDNAFDGFIYWSGISGFGPNSMILDGDFTRINTFANQQEKRSTVSLQILAGGPLAIADQFNTIKDNSSYYQNSQLLELNFKRITSKPLTKQLKDPKSQIWIGKISNDQWIVGLFNRENTLQSRNIQFQKQLGFIEGHVRDIWLHKDLGLKTALIENIAPHGCKIFKVFNNKYQAESPEFSLAQGVYAKEAIVALTSKTIGVSIHYTTNGDQPTVQSNLYKGPLALKNCTLIKAIATLQGMANSFIVSHQYNIKPEMINNQMAVAGTFSGWALPKMIMSYLGSNQWKSPYVLMPTGTYEFKVANSYDWSKDDWGNADGLNGFLTLTTQKAKNAKFNISKAGQYGFYFNELTLQYHIFERVLA